VSGKFVQREPGPYIRKDGQSDGKEAKRTYFPTVTKSPKNIATEKIKIKRQNDNIGTVPC
jgi:ferredoxin-NADP reductase